MAENIQQTVLKKVTAPLQKKSVKMNRRLFTFLVCICISAFFWLMLNLSRQYNITRTYPLKYVNMPLKKKLSEELPSKAEFNIKASGFKLLLFNIRNRKDSIVINFEESKHSKKNKKFYLLLNDKREKLASQLGSNVSILKVEPDTINFVFNIKTSKKK